MDQDIAAYLDKYGFERTDVEALSGTVHFPDTMEKAETLVAAAIMADENGENFGKQMYLGNAEHMIKWIERHNAAPTVSVPGAGASEEKAKKFKAGDIVVLSCTNDPVMTVDHYGAAPNFPGFPTLGGTPGLDSFQIEERVICVRFNNGKFLFESFSEGALKLSKYTPPD